MKLNCDPRMGMSCDSNSKSHYPYVTLNQPTLPALLLAYHSHSPNHMVNAPEYFIYRASWISACYNVTPTHTCLLFPTFVPHICSPISSLHSCRLWRTLQIHCTLRLRSSISFMTPPNSKIVVSTMTLFQFLSQQSQTTLICIENCFLQTAKHPPYPTSPLPTTSIIAICASMSALNPVNDHSPTIKASTFIATINWRKIFYLERDRNFFNVQSYNDNA